MLSAQCRQLGRSSAYGIILHLHGTEAGPSLHSSRAGIWHYLTPASVVSGSNSSDDNLDPVSYVAKLNLHVPCSSCEQHQLVVTPYISHTLAKTLLIVNTVSCITMECKSLCNHPIADLIMSYTGMTRPSLLK